MGFELGAVAKWHGSCYSGWLFGSRKGGREEAVVIARKTEMEYVLGAEVL